ncbi:malto-oligosyltrehalose synthase [Microbacterium paludicola]|uniref:Malto-oligosyltrehalose synthase n=1 Tax=Microbacterium paludicola TaxID=300019 RepID=A0A4Y9FZ28_9MICO|nr:malto-oligosyltrehalose synthase [Microbacterium paludicola]MBF0814953.1 malto-oligosyltrehalose synthase [Microbacterium paludicola]TFU34679.1 malto-oligosyltrehalose synthase [Microbacterium paludicola]
MSGRIPRSTYRLQIRREFDLDAAAGVVDYLKALGVDTVYLSPLLASEPGSNHGYDVIDHSRVDPDRGGSEGLERFATAAREAGLGVLADIVPNHVGIATPRLNPWWWDVLTHGRGSRHAEAFDIDWDAASGRIRIPVLGDDDVEKPDLGLRIEDGELRYYDNAFPLAPGTADDGASPGVVHARQHYELVHWRRGDSELNYRRFFAVSTLAAVRVEDPRVFDESHTEILRWLREGLVDGLRIDHPDGLTDPGGYLARLADASDGAYVLVEKILEPGEPLPAHWATAGTTGYDALGDIDRVLVDPAARTALDDLEAELRADSPQTGTAEWHRMIHDGKRAVADGLLQAEVRRLARLVPDIEGAEDALAELLACFPVYRSYLPAGLDHLHEAAAAAKRGRRDLARTIDRLLPLLADPDHPAAIRFQQTSGAVMAKGVEDTAFYRYGRLASLNEVGGDPAEFAIDVAEFHRRQAARQASWPLSMTTLSTHDTKRGEDTRARIDALAEVPELWRSTLRTLRTLAPLGDGPFESLLWASLIGAWPLSRERAHAYAEKAAREAGTRTTWTAPDEAFERSMHALVDAAFDDESVHRTLEECVGFVQAAGWSNSLSAKLLQLAAPGVPDVYQGSELWNRSLVDPDNRLPVDYAERRAILERIDGGELPDLDETAAAKLLVTTRVLRARRDRPELFTRYAGLDVTGGAAEHAIAFDRGGAVAVATRLPLGLERRGGWADARVMVRPGHYVDAITGVSFSGDALALADVLGRYPVALLLREG